MIQEVKERVKALLTDVICQVCTKEVPHKSQIQIEGTLCITSDTHPTFAIQIAQLLSKAEPITLQGGVPKTPTYPPNYGNGSNGPGDRTQMLPSGGSTYQQSQQQQHLGGGDNHSLQQQAYQDSTFTFRSQGQQQSQQTTSRPEVSPVIQMPPITDIPRRLTQPGETKHYIHPIKRRRLSSEPCIEMRPPPEPPRRRESESSVLDRSRYQVDDPEEIYQNVQRSARLVIKKVNMSDDNNGAEQTEKTAVEDQQSMQTLKSKLIGQPMVLRVDSRDGQGQGEMVMVVDHEKQQQQHSEILEQLNRAQQAETAQRSEIIDQLNRGVHQVEIPPSRSTETTVKDKVRSFLYKREKSVERLLDQSTVQHPQSSSTVQHPILSHSASAPSLIGLKSSGESTTGDPNIPTDLSRKSSISSTASSGSVIREMLQNYRGSSHDVYNLFSESAKRGENNQRKLSDQSDPGGANRPDQGTIKQTLHDLMSISNTTENLQKVMEMERRAAGLAAEIPIDVASFYASQSPNQPESPRTPNYPKYYLTTVGSQVVPVTIVPSSRGLATITEASVDEQQSVDIGGDGDPGLRGGSSLPALTPGGDVNARLTNLTQVSDSSNTRLASLAPVQPGNLQPVAANPNDTRNMYGTTYRLTPLSPAQTSQQSQYAIFQRSDSIKSESKDNREVESGVCGSSGRVKELDLGQMTKETINGLIIVDEDSHKTISPQDYIYKDESTGETQVRACEYCGKHFKYFSKLMEHIRSHTKQKPYKCSICGRTYTYKGDLTVHIRQHSSSKPFVCECGRAFASKKYLSVHQSQARIKGRHAIPKEGERADVLFDCKLCEKRFRFQSSFEMHMAIHEANGGGSSNDTGEFTCQTCGKVFKYLNSYDLHLQIHQTQDEDIKPETDGELYECQACNTCFKDHSLFVEHVLEHEKSKDGNVVVEDDGRFQYPELQVATDVTVATTSGNMMNSNLHSLATTAITISASPAPFSSMAMPGGIHLTSVPAPDKNAPVVSSNVRLTASAQLRCLSEMATSAQSSPDERMSRLETAVADSGSMKLPTLTHSDSSPSLLGGVHPGHSDGSQGASKMNVVMATRERSQSMGDILQQRGIVSTETFQAKVEQAMREAVGANIVLQPPPSRGDVLQPSSRGDVLQSSARGEVSSATVTREEPALSLIRTSVTQTEADSTNTTSESPINRSSHIE